MRRHRATLPLVMAVAFALSWGVARADDYAYPYHDPYLATITTAILNADGLTPGHKRQVVHVPVRTDRNRLPTLEGRGALSVALYRQSHAAPLLFILPGIGANPYFGAATYYAGLFHQRGFHVLILPSPLTWNFALAASRSGVPGYVPEDARDVYGAMQKTLEVLRGQIGLRITRIDFMGVSLGALEGAHLAVLDAREGKIGIQKYLLANPPADLTYTLKRIDEMEALRGTLGEARADALMLKALAIAEPFTEERRDDPEVFDKLVKDFSVFSTQEIQLLIAEYLQSVLPELVYVTEIMRSRDAAGMTKHDERRRLYEAKKVTFAQYSETIGLPVWRAQTGDPQADLESFTRRGSLAPILDELRANPRVYVIHNADDFLVERARLNALQQALGDRMVLYPYGGHLGNLWYSDTKKYALGLFSNSP